MKGFKKCCISSAVDGTHGDILWKGSEVDGMSSECEADDGTDYKDGGSDTVW